MVKLPPTAEIGFFGMARDEESLLQPYTYAERLPDDLSDRQCFVPTRCSPPEGRLEGRSTSRAARKT